MTMNYEAILSAKMDKREFDKLMAISHPELHKFVAESIELCQPDSVFVRTDSPEDMEYIRKKAVELGEEKSLALNGHTMHYDGYNDQGRDLAHTKYLLPKGVDLGALNSIDKEEGMAELKEILNGIMKGKEMIVLLCCLGPTNSEFSLVGVQLTDSYYVGHSASILYRPGYEELKRKGEAHKFFRFLHSAGRLEGNASVDVDKRRVYMDLEDEIVYSTNCQYAGNTLGFKKLAHRLAITKASREGWLAEHMFAMGVHGPNGRVTYLTGAFPSASGKTSTAMIPGETIVGDDLVYIKKINGEFRAVNVEAGIFGIIKDVTKDSDPVIWDVLTSPGEVIFSNVLDAEGTPYWINDGRQAPDHGINHSGDWQKGKKDANDNEVTLAHKNARYTIRLGNLANLDPKANDPDGINVGGVIYGGRDSDTWPPVRQANSWDEGVITIALSLESETTAATIGAEGVRKINPMSNIEFLAIPLGKYIQSHIDFVKDGLNNVPLIFGTNYFIRGKDGNYLTSMQAKYVWLKWMELRIHGEVDVIDTPLGGIPKYEDLVPLFKQVLNQDYKQEDYEEEFKIRIPENLAKIDRIETYMKEKASDVPDVVFTTLNKLRTHLQDAQKKHGDYISPLDF